MFKHIGQGEAGNCGFTGLEALLLVALGNGGIRRRQAGFGDFVKRQRAMGVGQGGLQKRFRPGDPVSARWHRCWWVPHECRASHARKTLY